MSMFQELDYNPDIQRVCGVQFSILSPDEIRRRSVAEIYTNECYVDDIPKTPTEKNPLSESIPYTIFFVSANILSNEPWP